MLERVGHLLAIDRALLKQYPYRSGYRDRWVTIPSDSFNGESPLQIMLTRGIEGIREIQEHLEYLGIRNTED